MLLPYVFQIAARDEHQIQVAYHLTMVAHDTAGTGSARHEVQLHHLVAVDGVVELLLVAVGHIHKLMLAQRRYLMQHF